MNSSIRTGLVVLSFPAACLLFTNCICFVHFDCEDEPDAEHDPDSPCWCKSGDVLKECEKLHGLAGSGGDDGIGGTTTVTGGSGGMGTGGDGGTTDVTTTGGGGFGEGGGDPCPGQKLCGKECVPINDPAYGCGETGCSPCQISEAVCIGDECAGPCGPVPPTGLFVCWVHNSPVGVSEYVGLAGGAADPDQGETIQNEFLDPMGNCVNSTPGEPFVLCDLGAPDPNWDIQFRGGRHLTPATGTIAGSWGCSDTSCTDDAYLYDDGAEIGSLVNDVESGAISTIPHFNPPGLLNAKVTVP